MGLVAALLMMKPGKPSETPFKAPRTTLLVVALGSRELTSPNSNAKCYIVSVRETVKDETTVHSELDSKGLMSAYERVVEQLASLDQKAQSMVSMEALLLALIAVFSSTIAASSNGIAVKAAAWASLVLILTSALCSLLVERVRYGTVIIARSPSLEEGLVEFRRWRDHKLKLHRPALTLLAAGLLGLMLVITIILL